MPRLKSRAQFRAVLEGKVLARTAHFALHIAPEIDAISPLSALFAGGGVWMGAVVPKRWAKRAVTRNTIKRQIFTVGAEVESLLLSRAHVVRLRAAFDRKKFPSATSDALKCAVRSELGELFRAAVACRQLA